MKLERLKNLREQGIFNEEELPHVDRIIKEFHLGEKNIGIPDVIKFKYYLGFDITYVTGEKLLKQLIDHCSPPPGIESFNDLFKKYGMTSYGLKDEWHWFREDTLTIAMTKKGLAPIESATELECWQMLALSAFYWQKYYEEFLKERNES